MSDVKFAAALAFVLLFAGRLAAKEGLDLVVLLDRSASMASDPRLPSLFLQMTVDLLARNAAASHVEHRLAIVTFNRSATVSLEFTTVDGDSVSNLRKQIAAMSLLPRGETDLLKALTQADGLFQSLDSATERRRALLLVTDGVPYLRGANLREYHADLRGYVASHFVGVTLNVLLSGSSGLSLLRFWRTLTPLVQYTRRTVPDVIAAGHLALSRLAGTQVSESASTVKQGEPDVLIVPPYLDVVVFDVFRASSEITVEIYQPGATTPLRNGVAGVEAFGIGDLLSTVVVPRPIAGAWKIRKSHGNARVRILSEQFFPRGQLLHPPSNTTIGEGRLTIIYSVRNGDHSALRELSEYPIELQLTLGSPDGAQKSITMLRDKVYGPSTFRSSTPEDCSITGRYWTDVRITTTDLHGLRFELFRDRWSGFTVAAKAQPASALHLSRPAITRESIDLRWILLTLPVGVVIAIIVITRARKP